MHVLWLCLEQLGVHVLGCSPWGYVLAPVLAACLSLALVLGRVHCRARAQVPHTEVLEWAQTQALC